MNYIIFNNIQSFKVRKDLLWLEISKTLNKELPWIQKQDVVNFFNRPFGFFVGCDMLCYYSKFWPWRMLDFWNRSNLKWKMHFGSVEFRSKRILHGFNAVTKEFCRLVDWLTNMQDKSSYHILLNSNIYDRLRNIKKFLECLQTIITGLSFLMFLYTLDSMYERYVTFVIKTQVYSSNEIINFLQKYIVVLKIYFIFAGCDYMWTYLNGC